MSENSPTDELLVLGQIYAEVGDYAASFIDCKHLSVAKFCSMRLKKIMHILINRRAVASEDELYEMTEVESGNESLKEKTIDELFLLFRRWPLRHEARANEGREHSTFYYEGNIVNELLKRKPANKAEQFKIDFCTLAYENEIENLSFVLDVPVSVGEDKLQFNHAKNYTPSELVALIKLYTTYSDIADRELLVEYVDYSLDLIKSSKDKASVLELATEIAELHRREIINIPKWLTSFIEESLTAVPDENKVLPMLTLAMIKNDQLLQNKSQKIVNRCYKMCFSAPDIDCLYIAVMCCDYISRFSVCKMASIWNELCETLQYQETSTDTIQIVKLLDIADQLASYAPISSEFEALLIGTLKQRAVSGELEAQASIKRRNLSKLNLRKAV